jgi:hypothetical protein
MGTAVPNKAQKGLNAQGAHLLSYPLSGQRQGIEQMREAHQIMRISLQVVGTGIDRQRSGRP